MSTVNGTDAEGGPSPQINLTAVLCLLVGAVAVRCLQPGHPTLGTVIAVAAAASTLLLPPYPLDQVQSYGSAEVNLTAALSLLAGYLMVLVADGSSLTTGMAIAAAAAAAVMLLPPLPMPWWVVTLLYVTGGVLQLLWRCLRPAQPRQAAPPKVEGLFVYPVKSCQGQPQPSATLDRFGFVGDRRLMVVAATPAHGAHPALTQRQLPKMATIACAPAFDGGSLSLSAPGRERLLLPRSPAQGAEGEGAKRRLHVRGR